MEKHAAYLLEGVDACKDAIFAAERHIWSHPESGYREWKTHKYMADIFENLGYELTLAGNIPGFYTVLDTGRPGPTVCVFAELDSLINENHPECDPETKAVHSCGHHMQCAGMVGLATTLKRPGALDGMSGKIMLCLVPAEELIEIEYRQKLIEQGTIKYLTGKAEFMSRGYFDDVDIAFLVHAGGDTPLVYLSDGGCGSISKRAVFHGIAGHAAFPENNINALYAATQALSACNALREGFKEDIRWHPILTEGGAAVNATPDRVVLESMVRGSALQNIIAANARINRAIAGSAASMGATATISDQIGYTPNDNDLPFNQVVCDTYKEIFPDGTAINNHVYLSGSTDLGFLSPMISVSQISSGGGCSGDLHSSNFKVNDPTFGTVVAAKLEAMLLWNLLKNDAELGNRIKANFKPQYASREEYFQVLDKLNSTKNVVTVQENGDILLSC